MDGCQRYQVFDLIDRAYRDGDMAALRRALGEPGDFPNSRQPRELGIGDRPLEYAIYWSPLAFIAELLVLGADPNHADDRGFPSLIAALSTGRSDRLEIMKLLLEHGASLDQRGINDWTPLHHAVALRDLPAVLLLLRHGADPEAPTCIDDQTTPLEDAVAAGFAEAVAAMRKRTAERTAS